MGTCGQGISRQTDAADDRAGERQDRQSVSVPPDARPVDPRDQMWEVHEPRYRVHFWDADARSDEWELTGVDVQEALHWAQDSAGGRSFTFYAVADAVGREGLGLIRLLGVDPIRN
jgi:hypothetical protein